MDTAKVRFINNYNPAKGGTFVLNEYYENDEGLNVDTFKGVRPSFDKSTGTETIAGFPVVYQVTDHKNIPSIFKSGFDRSYTGSKAGNMYGPGTYSTYKLTSTEDNVKHGHYGDTFVRMAVLSKLKDFLIYDAPLAKKVHGENWHIKSQLLMFFGEEKCNEFKRRGLWPYISEISGRTSNNALAVWTQIGDKELVKYGVSGFIFQGGHDGFVSVIRDFKNCLPVAYSTDRGRTWKSDYFTQETVDRIFNDVDGHTFYGKDIDKFKDTKDVSSGLNKLINGIILAKTKDNKYNFYTVDHKILSPYINFDVASPFRKDGKAYVEINSPKYIEIMDEPFKGYVSKDGVYADIDDDEPMSWEDFNDFIKENGIN